MLTTKCLECIIFLEYSVVFGLSGLKPRLIGPIPTLPLSHVFSRALLLIGIS